MSAALAHPRAESRNGPRTAPIRNAPCSDSPLRECNKIPPRHFLHANHHPSLTPSLVFLVASAAALVVVLDDVSPPSLPMAAAGGVSLARLPEPQVIPISPKGRERPLPSLPSTAMKSKAPSMKFDEKTRLSAVVAGKRRAAPIPSIAPSDGIRRMLNNTVILSRLSAVTPWPSFQALISTCKEFRQIFARPELRDVILSRFVPGYKLCLGNRDLAELSVDITIEDINLLRKHYVSYNHYST